MNAKYPDLYLKLMDRLITLETERKIAQIDQELAEELAKGKPLSRGQKKRLRYHKRTRSL